MNAYHDLVELDAEECWELLASVEVSRVGIEVDGRIDVLPVNHPVDRSGPAHDLDRVADPRISGRRVS